MTPTHSCEQHEKFLEIATFTGQIHEAVKNIRDDLNVLFNEMRNMKDCMGDIKKEISENNKNQAVELSNTRLKFTFIGVIGAGIFQIGMIFINKLF